MTSAVEKSLKHTAVSVREVVLTGRDPAPSMPQAADFCTEMCARRHPYDRGVPARPGIEY